MREHPDTGPYVEGLSTYPVASYADIQVCIEHTHTSNHLLLLLDITHPTGCPTGYLNAIFFPGLFFILFSHLCSIMGGWGLGYGFRVGVFI